MEIDKITLSDLSIFNTEEEFSIFNRLNFTITSRGRDQLYRNISTPLKTLNEILAVQQTIKHIRSRTGKWPKQISNGSVMVIERFYETIIDQIPGTPNSFTAWNYRLLHSPDFSLVKYSAVHCFDFIKGMQEMIALFEGEDLPLPLKNILEKASLLLKKDQLGIVEPFKKSADMPLHLMLRFAHFIRYRFKQPMLELIQVYAQLDAWYSMAIATDKYGLAFPEITNTEKPYLEIEGLFHILLQDPVAYDVELEIEKNFLFLTGANMAGKSTFIKSVGTAVFLAHLGMAVPARAMKLSMFDGILSNINIIDNIAKGESYFFNEVQRIKSTLTKISDKRKWLVLIDELFKGTNVQDAMKCSTAVIEGFLQIRNTVFILSTHLYEIAGELQRYPNIRFNFFETMIEGDQLSFSYQLRNGVSNDRLGYLILKKEGVVQMLDDLKSNKS